MVAWGWGARVPGPRFCSGLDLAFSRHLCLKQTIHFSGPDLRPLCTGFKCPVYLSLGGDVQVNWTEMRWTLQA